MASSLYTTLDKKIRDIFENQSMGFCDLRAAQGAAVEQLESVLGIHYIINGVPYHKAQTNPMAVAALAAQADLTTAYYLVVIGTTGTIALVAPPAAITGNCSTVNLLLGAQPANTAVIGVIKCVTSGATWTAGTDSFMTATTFAGTYAYPREGDPTGLTYGAMTQTA